MDARKAEVNQLRQDLQKELAGVRELESGELKKLRQLS
jgi:hypothetical protein